MTAAIRRRSCDIHINGLGLTSERAFFYFARGTKRHTFPQRDRGGTVTEFKLLSRSSHGLDAGVVLLVRHASTKVRA
jgi:hypothetical protein